MFCKLKTQLKNLSLNPVCSKSPLELEWWIKAYELSPCSSADSFGQGQAHPRPAGVEQTHRKDPQTLERN